LRLLVVKLSSLGDVVQTLPVLHDIHARFPQAKIDWVVEEAFAELVRQAPSVERVIPVAQRRWRRSPLSRGTRGERNAAHAELRREAYDAVIDFQGLVKSAVVARRARLAPGGFTATYGNRSELCGYEWPVRYLLQRKVAMPLRIHAVARARLLAAKALGYEVPDSAPVYPWTLDAPVSPPRVLLAHGTTRADNEWPADDWIALGRVLAQQGFEVLLPQANAAEEDLAARVAAGIGGGARVLPRMGLPALLAQMRGCSGLIGVDSGVAHMGVALDLPVVEIFSQPRAWRAGPVGRPHQRSVGGEAAPTAADVIAAWNGCWEARPVADLA
jgi:heptosyltransferase I